MKGFRNSIIIFICALIGLGATCQVVPNLVLPKLQNEPIRIELGGFNGPEISEGYEELAVFVENGFNQYENNYIQGSHKIEEDYLYFTPYFPFDRGISYIVRTKNSKGNFVFESFEFASNSEKAEPGVSAIYPTSDKLPENLLRFYIYFETPMKKGNSLDHIQLVDQLGNVDSSAFMQFKQELWSSDGKRLTILFDPGRIKRGVGTNLRKGPALNFGKRYRLKILSSWQDVYGRELSSSIAKEFTVVNPYRSHLDPKKWKMIAPELNSRDSLTFHFNRIIDHAIALTALELFADDQKINGEWVLSENQNMIHFIPDSEWKSGNYSVLTYSKLEDVCGNNLQNLLDHTMDDAKVNDRKLSTFGFKL